MMEGGNREERTGENWRQSKEYRRKANIGFRIEMESLIGRTLHNNRGKKMKGNIGTVSWQDDKRVLSNSIF